MQNYEEWAKWIDAWPKARAELDQQAASDPHLRTRLVALNRLLHDTADEVRRARKRKGVDARQQA